MLPARSRMMVSQSINGCTARSARARTEHPEPLTMQPRHVASSESMRSMRTYPTRPCVPSRHDHRIGPASSLRRFASNDSGGSGSPNCRLAVAMSPIATSESGDSASIGSTAVRCSSMHRRWPRRSVPCTFTFESHRPSIKQMAPPVVCTAWSSTASTSIHSRTPLRGLPEPSTPLQPGTAASSGSESSVRPSHTRSACHTATMPSGRVNHPVRSAGKTNACWSCMSSTSATIARRKDSSSTAPTAAARSSAGKLAKVGPGCGTASRMRPTCVPKSCTISACVGLRLVHATSAPATRHAPASTRACDGTRCIGHPDYRRMSRRPPAGRRRHTSSVAGFSSRPFSSFSQRAAMAPSITR